MTVETIALNHLWRTRRSKWPLLAGIALSVAITVTLSLLSAALMTSVGDAFDEIGPNLLVRPAGFDETVDYGGVVLPGSGAHGVLKVEDYIAINSIANKENIAAIAPKIIDEASYRGESFVIAGVYFQFERIIKKWWRFEGDWPFADDEILIGTRLAERIDVQVGGTIELSGETFVVTAVLEAQHTEEDDMVFGNILTVQELYDRPGEVTFIEVAAYCTTCPLPLIAEQIGEKLPNAEVFEMSDVVAAREATVGRFVRYGTAVSAVVLLIAVVVVSLVMMSSVNERTAEIGMLRTAGYRRTHIIEVVLTESAILGVIGGLIGYVAGVMLARALAPEFELGATDISWNPLFGSLVLLGSTSLGMLAGIVPAMAASRTDPMHALNRV